MIYKYWGSVRVNYIEILGDFYKKKFWNWDDFVVWFFIYFGGKISVKGDSFKSYRWW